VIQGDTDPGSTTDTAIPNLGMLTKTFAFSGAIEIDHVELVVSVPHVIQASHLWIALTSAEGTRIQLWDGTPINGNFLPTGFPNTVAGWAYGVEGLRGEDPNGTWTLEISDVVARNSGSLNWYQLNIYGSAADTDDVFHFTDEYSDMAAFEGARLTVSDTNGGEDWINAAAVSTASSINLASGATSTIDGTRFTLAGGTVIEHAIGGTGTTASPATASATSCRACAATTRCAAMTATTSCAAAPAGTCSPAAPATTHWSAGPGWRTSSTAAPGATSRAMPAARR
jgi:subtilisin-like proprotein convertase family protein